MATLKKETLLEWYRQMVLIRLFETRCDELYREKKITGVYLHLYSCHFQIHTVDKRVSSLVKVELP